MYTPGIVFWQFSTNLIQAAPVAKKMKHPGSDRVGRQNVTCSIVLNNELPLGPIAEDACGTTPLRGHSLQSLIH